MTFSFLHMAGIVAVIQSFLLSSTLFRRSKNDFSSSQFIALNINRLRDIDNQQYNRQRKDTLEFYNFIRIREPDYLLSGPVILFLYQIAV